MEWGALLSGGTRALGHWKQRHGQVVLGSIPRLPSVTASADMVQAFVGWAGSKGLWAGPMELEIRWGGAGPRPAHKGLRR